jgi:hypothetical protein
MATKANATKAKAKAKKKMRVDKPPCKLKLDPDGKCRSRKPWCTKDGNCGQCKRHCNCPKRLHTAKPKALGDHTGTGAEPEKKVIPRVPTRFIPQRRRALEPVPIYVDLDSDVDDESLDDLELEFPPTISQVPVQSLENLNLAFPPTISLNNMPSAKRRKSPTASTEIQTMKSSQRAQETMVSLLYGIMEKSAAIILPGNPDFLLSGVMERLQKKL